MHGGARVGAGRKPNVENYTIGNILRLSASTILKALRDPSIPLIDKAELASKYLVRKVRSADSEAEEKSGGNRILIYVERGDASHREQIHSALSASENPRIEETISDSDSGQALRKERLSGE